MLELRLVYGGQSHPLQLGDGEHSVGRSSDSAVKIPVARVSKNHAMLRVAGDELFVRDLGSTNGTEVNGQAVGPTEMAVPKEATVSFGGAVLRRATDTMRTSAILAPGGLSSAERFNMRQGFSENARDRIINISSELFELLASGEDAVEMEKAACRFVSHCVAADRVVLLENQGEATTEIDVRARWTRHGDDSAPLQLSSTIVGQVLRERDAVLVANPLEDPRYTEQQSIMALNLRSAMAAPLFDNERVRGILYVDTASAGVQYTNDDLQVLTATANAVAVKLRNLTLEGEMRTAAKIQRGMLPEIQTPEGYELEAYQLMCRQVGGDLYHCVRRPNGTVLLTVGDVSGKGTPAALAMSAATVLIGMLAEIGGDLADLTRHLHNQLYRSFTTERFITLFIGELDAESGRMRYVNAGHEPPCLLHPDGNMDLIDPTGMAVAMIEELFFDVSEVQLQHGDVLAIFTDGVTEATTNGDRFLGSEPVKEILREHKDKPLSEIRKLILDEIENFLQGDSPSDDVTLMLIRRNPV